MAILDIIMTHPKISIIILALAISFIISLVNYFLLDKERMRQLKQRQKEIQEKIKHHQKSGDMEKAMALQKELLADMPELMKHSLKPAIITIIPMLILFSFIRGAFAQTSIAETWFWYYLFTAIIGSMIFRKLLKLP